MRNQICKTKQKKKKTKKMLKLLFKKKIIFYYSTMTKLKCTKYLWDQVFNQFKKRTIIMMLFMIIMITVIMKIYNNLCTLLYLTVATHFTTISNRLSAFSTTKFTIMFLINNEKNATILLTKQYYFIVPNCC